MRDEGPYLLEWVAYHRLIGFTDIVVCSNDCVDGSPAHLWLDTWARALSPYETNPLDINPLRDALEELIDFERVFRRAAEAGLIEYIVERDDAGSPPRTPAQALDTARVGYQYLTGLRY